ncbi:DNA repair protein complementing XP-G cells homolog [Eumeta japonica]|uniref:DNA repair protein complementing XP-G cells homolog n=1 Tax=Eumeta variegata TaxID=151549 RepID=A0A4C1U2V0_EUMVA|nr:DNA repair protein complementing XP-G cells homolog [Eumeta japonica]
MGVTGLWRLIEPAGKPVPVESLENKVLAVDISIWLHQVVKGYQDAKGAPLPNAHLIGLFQRLCKLLYFRIKPVFVFDGAFPELKKETIAKRNSNKIKYNSESERLRREILLLLGKRTAISTLIGNDRSPTKVSKQTTSKSDDDMFKLPALPQKKEETESESEEDESSSSSIIDLHSVDIEAEEFKGMPLKDKYDLLIELKETRKMNSWGRLHELPKKSDNFSDFQMKRLLKRRKVQEVLEETEKEMGGNSLSLNELESLLNEEGITTEIQSLPSNRIASSDTTRFVLIKDVKQTLEDARKQQKAKENQISALNSTSSTSKSAVSNQTIHSTISDANKQDATEGVSNAPPKKDEFEEDLQRAIQMSLECINEENECLQQSITSNNASNLPTNEIADITINTAKHDPSKHIIDQCKKDFDKNLNEDVQISEILNEPNEDSFTTFKTQESANSTYTCDSEYSSSEEDVLTQPDMAAAKSYLMQYSDFTHKTVNKLVSSEIKYKTQTNKSKIEKILEDLEKEKTVIADTIDLDSSESISSERENKNIESPQDIDRYSERDVGVLDTSVEEHELFLEQTSVDRFSSSVAPIINPENESIKLKFNIDKEVENSKVEIKNIESEEDDDEFEDVPDAEIKNETKTVVELNLDMGEAPADDIFADIFENQMNQQLKQNYSNNESPIQTMNNIMNENVNSSKSLIANLVSKNQIKLDITEREESDLVTSKEIIESSPNVSEITNISDSDSKSITTAENSITSNDTPKSVMDEKLKEKLQDLADAMQIEEQDIIQEKSRLDRMGRNINEQMTKEVQELLQLFGIPYIVAPMEAEAQCAFLETVKLTDGTITDDSDIWLFGGRTVYKNFFNQQKHVKQFLAERIEKSFNLNREQLVLLALLVGSDYTTGIPGVGPVTAMEILASFPYSRKELQAKISEQSRYTTLLSGLLEFKRWVKSGKRTDNTNLKKKLRNVDVADEFPSIRVVQAYLEPNVEKSEESFTWGQPDMTILCDYAKSKFGWSQNKFEEIIKPVVKRMQDRKTQRTVYDYFKRKIEFQSLEEHMSKRVRAAVNKMDPDKLVNEDFDPNQKTASDKKRKTKKTKKKGLLESSDAAVNATTDNSTKEGKKNTAENIHNLVKIETISKTTDTSNIEIQIPKLNRHQEIIPQREKDMENILKNKLKAIELFRKSKIDKKTKRKRKIILPKEKAELSESSDSD